MITQCVFFHETELEKSPRVILRFHILLFPEKEAKSVVPLRGRPRGYPVFFDVVSSAKQN
jgi:hypothetical protein